jgi:hypothetical protein
MSYGTKSWRGWVLEGDEGVAQIKAAWEAGINVRSISSSVITNN